MSYLILVILLISLSDKNIFSIKSIIWFFLFDTNEVMKIDFNIINSLILSTFNTFSSLNLESIVGKTFVRRILPSEESLSYVLYFLWSFRLSLEINLILFKKIKWFIIFSKIDSHIIFLKFKIILQLFKYIQFYILNNTWIKNHFKYIQIISWLF